VRLVGADNALRTSLCYRLHLNGYRVLSASTRQSAAGTGLRGHGGSGFGSPSPADERQPRPIGGVFSTGELQDARVPGGGDVQEVSVTRPLRSSLCPANPTAWPPTGGSGTFPSLAGPGSSAGPRQRKGVHLQHDRRDNLVVAGSAIGAMLLRGSPI
jgi:hypothetical protein